VVPSHDTQLIENLTRDLQLDAAYADDTFLDYSEPTTAGTGANPPTKFDKAVEIGNTLNNAIRSKDSVARWFFKNYPGFQMGIQRQQRAPKGSREGVRFRKLPVRHAHDVHQCYHSLWVGGELECGASGLGLCSQYS
jgi:hypothetical protein